MATRILIVRHGETVWNVEGRVQGSKDIPLTERGRQQARQLAQRLSAEPIHTIYSSPQIRAWDTAAAVAEYHPKAALVTQPELAEFSFGAFEGWTVDRLLAEIDESRLNTDDAYRLSLGAEPKQPVTVWALSFFPTLAQKHQGQTVLLSTHGAKKRHLLSSIFPERKEELNNSHPGNCSLTIVHWHPETGPSLELLYDSSHLEGLTFEV